MSIAVIGQTNQYHNEDIDDRIFKVGIDVYLGLTTKKSPFNYGLGFDIQTQYYLSEQLTITAAGGYARLLTKDTSPQADFDFIPLSVGAKIFPAEKIYINLNAGSGFPLQKDSKILFVFGGGIGYEYNRDLDFSIKYAGYQQTKSSSTYQPLNGLFAFQLGYNF